MQTRFAYDQWGGDGYPGYSNDHQVVLSAAAEQLWRPHRQVITGDMLARDRDPIEELRRVCGPAPVIT